MQRGNLLNIMSYLPYLFVCDQRVIDISRSFLDMTGYSKDDFISKDISEVFYQLFGESFNEEILKCAFEMKECHIYTKSLQEKQIYMLIQKSKTGNESIFIFLEKSVSDEEKRSIMADQKKLINASEQIKYREAVKKQCYQICELLDNLDLPIVRLTYPELRIIEINQKAYKELLSLDICKPNSKEMLKPGESIYNIMPGLFSDGRYKSIFNIQKAGNTIQNSIICLMKNGNKTYYNAICQPILNMHGKIAELIIAAMDVTGEIMEKEEIKRFMKIKDEFFLFISHEFKTPLTIINAAIQALELVCGKELSEKAMKFIRQIRQNSLRQLRLVNNLLEITRAENGYLKLHKKNVDIVLLTKEIIESVLQYSRGKNINLSFHSSLGKKVIAIDDEKYDRILLNLLSNAIKFTPAGKNIFVRVYSKEKQVCIEVKDEGVGIPKQKQSLIFSMFGQVDSSLVRNTEGTGIGLFLVKMLVNAMKGKIEIESEEGIGSTFTIILPDEKCSENYSHSQVEKSVDDRLVRMIEIELSDIFRL
ncbi:MAG TPA: PAS domain-containing sensor histidine kinase [Clostridiaceae bacterium]|nr:PAS domain-containing sensor histidine kinase [Clostridiaceae bacterium]